MNQNWEENRLEDNVKGKGERGKGWEGGQGDEKWPKSQGRKNGMER